MSKEIERRLSALESVIGNGSFDNLSPEEQERKREFAAYDRLMAAGDVEGAYAASPIMAAYRSVFEKLAVEWKAHPQECKEMKALCAEMDELERNHY
jgi:hypothetical protein